MSKDFVQTANDVVTGGRTAAESSARYDKGLQCSVGGGNSFACHRHENEGTHGARDRRRGLPYRRQVRR
jgi:hypothetical protein